MAGGAGEGIVVIEDPLQVKNRLRFLRLHPLIIARLSILG